MPAENILIIFIRNPELGKVKTRLAKTVGDKKALEIYQDLLKHTNLITSSCSADKAIFYSHFIDDYDSWSNVVYQKFVQEGGSDLGARMENGIELVLKRGYKNVVLIGSDCLELTAQGIEEAFYALNKHDVVVGPAKDGGYYLLGMKKTHHEFFKNKKWSTEDVFLDTSLDIENLGLSYLLLDTLSDVDCEDDLKQVEA